MFSRYSLEGAALEALVVLFPQAALVHGIVNVPEGNVKDYCL